MLGTRPTNEEINASKFDRAVAHKQQPSDRVRGNPLMEVQCIECNNWFDVSPLAVRRDVMTNEPAYICNNCEISRRR